MFYATGNVFVLITACSAKSLAVATAITNLGQYSPNFIAFANYESSDKLDVTLQLAGKACSDKHSTFWDPFLSYEENEGL